VRWQYRDAGLLWPFAPAYAMHIAEEWFAGFPGWAARITGRPIPETAFIVINAVAMVLLLAAVRAATRDERHGWMAVGIATIFLVNTVAHAAGAVMTQSYAPGVISAVVLYVPLGALTMIRAFEQAPRAQLARGIIAGVLVHAIVSILALASTRLPA
jgi:hypothetical protein